MENSMNNIIVLVYGKPHRLVPIDDGADPAREPFTVRVRISGKKPYFRPYFGLFK